MHPIVYVNCVKVSVINSNTEQYGIIVYDQDDKTFDLGYSTLAEFLQAYPTRDSILEWLSVQDGFEDYNYYFVEPGSFSRKFPDEIDSFAVVLSGYPNK